MRIIVLGGTSLTGQAILKELAQQPENKLTALVRNSGKLPAAYPYQVIVADMVNQVAVSQALAGQEIVIAGLSGATIKQQAENLVTAAAVNHVRRIFWITGLGIHHEVKGVHGWYLNHLSMTMPEYVQSADLIADSPVPSTLLRLPMINNQPIEKYYLRTEKERTHSFQVSRLAIAKAIAYLLTKNPTRSDESLAITN